MRPFVVVAVALGLAGAAAAAPFQRGVCYAHTWHHGGRAGYGSAASARTLEHLRALGVDWISLTPFGFMESRDAAEVRTFAAGAGESDERLRAEVTHAHALGVKVALKPHLWIRGGAWQGELAWRDEAAFRRWFSSYRAFVLRYAELAARDRYDLFVLGVELKSATARDPAAWRALIADVRKVWKGPLTYAANWDEAPGVAFWDALDFVGVDAYAPLARTPGAREPELCAAWRTLASELESLARRTGRPILITELGYRAVRDAALAPAAWPEDDANPRFDPEHQASCYRAALSTLWGKPWLAGVYFWKWFTDGRDESGPTDFSPAGKPAEGVLRDYYLRP
jgi:hypothetical protein